MCDVELLIIDVVEKHIDTTEIVGGNIDLLPIESLSYIVFSEYFCELQKERTRSTTWIIDFIHFRFSYGRDLREELTHLLR